MAQAPKAPRCPVCKSPQQAEYRPFCSRACRDRDLLKWLGEGYAVPGPPADADMQKDEE
ncbi:DNA gyrase inhibitor YacG [Sphingobium sp. H39-3-25]|uniref:DNA gyrase inhibitor YacG n=1 Tax=Sphingobium arseniciresistens TaxID=3030834 RepID=UPI0023B91FC6|nr:DNA gyrase inhibitor YacG [Sphingobium arseniciresistens]